MRLILAADTIHTMSGSPTNAQVVVLENGRVAGLAQRHALTDIVRSGDEVREFGDATIVPGLIDAHTHPVLGATLTDGIDLTDVQSREGFVAALAQRSHGTWTVGWGLDPNAVGEDALSAAFLERIAPGRPILVRLFDGHAAIASAEALRRAGVTGRVAFGSTAEVACDEFGAPTGTLLESPAIALVEAALPPVSDAERITQIRARMREMSRAGLTSGHVLDLVPGTVEYMTAIEADGELPLRLLFAPVLAPEGSLSQKDVLALQGRRGRRWLIEGVKFYADGTIDNGTAWLRAPDRDGASTSCFWGDPAEFDAAQKAVLDSGVPTRTHAIGDAAIERVIRNVERFRRPLTSAVHRIEHLELFADDLIDRMVAAGIAASMQPLHCTEFTAADYSDNWSSRVGAARAHQGWPLASVRSAGGVLALGSDWPIAPFDPRLVLASAQSRRSSQHSGEPIRPEQALTPRQALEGMTTHAARSVGDPFAGYIAPGSHGDVTVFNVDPLRATADELASSDVLMTVVGGRIEHQV